MDAKFENEIIRFQVRAVSYLMLNSETVLHTSRGHGDLERVPLGTTLSLSVSFHDSEGAQFDATSSKIGFRENRFVNESTMYRLHVTSN